jgi:hypothetical protein
MRILRFAMATALPFVAAGSLFAQSLTGAITGTVKDEQGGALPGVTITLAGKTGVKTTTTDPEGMYRFPALEVGTYRLEAAMTGFQGRKQDNVVITIGAKLTLDFALKVGAMTETIEVTGEAPVVDVTSNESSNTISQDLLFNMPIQRFAPEILNYAPGINDESAYGGGSGTGNALLIDGVDTRDPEGGTAWSFFNYNVVEEVQVQGLGAPAEYGAYTGAVVNTVTKSGGNEFSGLFDANYTTDSLSSDNRSTEIRQATCSSPTCNPTIDPSRTTGFLDWTAQIGGPVKKDKLFFFLSAQRYHLKQDPDGPRTQYEELSHRFNAKATYTPSPNDTLTGHLEFDDYNIHGRTGFDHTIDTNAQTVAEDAPEWVWNVQWRHLFGANTFFETKYVGWWGYYYLDPQTPGARYYDVSFNGYNTQPPGSPFGGLPSSAGNFYYADRGRHEVHASISHFAEAFGHHDMKFGVQIERSRVRTRYGYPGGFNFYDSTLGGYPVGQYTAYSYGYDVAGRNRRDSIYVQDSWKPSSRLTINAGGRLDWIRGLGDQNSASLGKVYDTKSWAPRIGVAFDLTGDHKTVLKAHYGQYYEAAFFTLYERALSGRQDLVLYAYDGVSQEPGGPPGFYEYARRPYSAIYKVDPNIKHPRVDEWTAGFERALGNDMRFAVTGIYRENKNIVDAVLPDARFAPVSFTPSDTDAAGNPISDQFGPINTFAWLNADTSQPNGLITNVDGWKYLDANGNVVATAHAYRKYKGLMFVLTKRLSKRWQAQASYVLSRNTGTNDNFSFSTATGISSVWKTPLTAVTNNDGRTGEDLQNEVKIFAGYEIPKAEISVNAYYRYLGGLPYNVRYRLNSDDRDALGFPGGSTTQRTVLLEPRGSRALPNQSLLDLRVEKIFKLSGGKDRISVYADIANVFNSGTVSEVEDLAVGETLGAQQFVAPLDGPLSLIPPRQVTFGARWSF